MSRQASAVAVVGGGIVGTALAYYLAERGVRDVVLLERSQVGSGTTGNSAGGVRQQFATELEIEMSRRGLDFWKSVEARFDSPCPFYSDGYLLLTGQDSIAAEFAAAGELQKRAGLAGVELVPADRLSELVPWISGEGLIVGSWSPGDGRVTPLDGVVALARAARRLGVDVREGWQVDAIRRHGSAWTIDGTGRLEAEQVVVATGYWTPELLRPLGHEIDIRLNTQYQLLSEPIFAGERVPITIDVDSGLFVEREGAGLALAVIGREPPLTSHAEVVSALSRRVKMRAPALIDVKIAKEVTLNPAAGGDGSPYVGQLDDGLWTCCFVGHGAMHGPPVAEVLARLLAGDPDPSIDISAWDPHRVPAKQNSVWWRRPEPEYVRLSTAAAER